MDMADKNLIEAYKSIEKKFNEKKDFLEKRKQEINLLYEQISMFERIEDSQYVKVYTNRIKFFEWQYEIEKMSKDEFSKKIYKEKNDIEAELQLMDNYLMALKKEKNTWDILKDLKDEE